MSFDHFSSPALDEGEIIMRVITLYTADPETEAPACYALKRLTAENDFGNAKGYDEFLGQFFAVLLPSIRSVELT